MARIAIRQIFVNPAKYQIDLAYARNSGHRDGGVVFLDLAELVSCLREIGLMQKANEIAVKQEQGACWVLLDLTDDDVMKFQSKAA